MKLFSKTLALMMVATPLSATTLQEAIDITINNDPDVLSLAYQRQAVEQEIKQAKAGYYPSVDLTVGTGWEETDNPSTRASGKGNRSLNRDEANLQIRQMLFDGMATKSEVTRQTARTNSRAYTVYSEAENIALRAVDAYLNVLRRQSLVKLAEENFEAHQNTYEQIELRSQYGVGRGAELEQIQGRLALTRTNLLAEKSNLKDAEISYLRVVGIEPEELSYPESITELLPDSLEEAMSRSLEQHPTLNSANADVESAYAQHSAAESAFYPRVDLELGSTANNDIDGIKGHNKDITAMFRMRYNLYSGGRDSARRQETAILINQAKEIRNRTRREVEESVRLSWNAWETVRDQIALFEVQVESNEKTRDAYQQQFSLGRRSLLDLLDSENELFVAKQSLINAVFDQLFANYRIINSMGQLLNAVNVTPPAAVKIIE